MAQLLRRIEPLWEGAAFDMRSTGFDDRGRESPEKVVASPYWTMTSCDASAENGVNVVFRPNLSVAVTV